MCASPGRGGIGVARWTDDSQGGRAVHSEPGSDRKVGVKIVTKTRLAKARMRSGRQTVGIQFQSEIERVGIRNDGTWVARAGEKLAHPFILRNRFRSCYFE